MSDQRFNRESGLVISGMLISLVVSIVLLIGFISFGVWAFMGRQDYKNNSDAKVAVAVAAAKRQTQATDAALYAEAAKSPFTTYTGPAQYGSVKVTYPKTWSAYAVENSNSSTPVNDYFHPAVVPDAAEKDNAYALRLQVTNTSYDQVLKQYQSSVQTGKVTIKPYSLPNVSSVVGSRVDGQITNTKQGSVIVLPLRNLTLEIWTESNTFLPDFNNTILKNLSFSP